MKNTKIYIYSLCDPETKEIRYVGKTNDPVKTFKEWFNLQ